LADDVLPPFSARNRGAHAQIDNECPETTRIGLLHLVHRLVELRYVEDWKSVAEELKRIGRVRPDADIVFAQLLMEIAWDRVFDYCERLHSHLAQDVWTYNQQAEDLELTKPRSEVQQYIANELQLLFLEERLAFQFTDGQVRRRGRRNTAEQISRAELVLGDSRLVAARLHFGKALRYFRNVSQLDPENVIKEAVCAVEATARALFPSGGSTLGSIVNSITGNEVGQLPQSIAKTFHGMYGFRSAGEGVGHGGTTGGPATKELAEYALAVCASQIVLLVDIAGASEPDIPF
jgi:hypothetical protein